MKKDYTTLKNKVIEMNNLNDQISLIKWNNDDGPKFNSVKEMKDFIKKIENDDFNYILENIIKEEKTNNLKEVFIESYQHTKDNIFFFIFTFQKNNDYITYLSLKNLEQDDMINNLCGKQNVDKKSAHLHFENLKNIIISNNIDDILENLIIGATNKIEKLKFELQELTSES